MFCKMNFNFSATSDFILLSANTCASNLDQPRSLLFGIEWRKLCTYACPENISNCTDILGVTLVHWDFFCCCSTWNVITPSYTELINYRPIPLPVTKQSKSLLNLRKEPSEITVQRNEMTATSINIPVPTMLTFCPFVNKFQSLICDIMLSARLLTHCQMRNFRLFHTERVCRQQFQIWWKWQKVIQTGRKHCGRRRNCLLRAISPFPTVFSKGLLSRGFKRRHCVGMGQFGQVWDSVEW